MRRGESYQEALAKAFYAFATGRTSWAAFQARGEQLATAWEASLEAAETLPQAA